MKPKVVSAEVQKKAARAKVIYDGHKLISDEIGKILKIKNKTTLYKCSKFATTRVEELKKHLNFILANYYLSIVIKILNILLS